jgi:hypothetical protein
MQTNVNYHVLIQAVMMTVLVMAIALLVLG